VQAGLYGKKMVVHVDRVKHLDLSDEQVIYDSNKTALFLNQPNDEVPYTREICDRDPSLDICENQDAHAETGSQTKYYSPEADFSACIESDTDDEDAGAENRDGNIQPADAQAAALPPVPPAVNRTLTDAQRLALTLPRTSRAQAASSGVPVPEWPLPTRCPTSKRGAHVQFGRQQQ